MKHHHRIILTIVILIIIAFAFSYFSTPKKAAAPINKQTSAVPTPDQTGEVKAVATKIDEDASNTPSVAVEYPQFPALPADFNTTIAKSVNDRLADFRATVKDNDASRKATALPSELAIPLSAYSFIATWEPIQVNNKYVSVIVRYDAYAGGANGDQELETFNYDVGANKILALVDLFPNSSDYLKQISVLVRKDLTASMDKASDGNVPTDMLNAGTEPTADNFMNFTFTDDAVTFYFPKYAVAPGSFGEQKATIARSLVK